MECGLLAGSSHLYKQYCGSHHAFYIFFLIKAILICHLYTLAARHFAIYTHTHLSHPRTAGGIIEGNLYLYSISLLSSPSLLMFGHKKISSSYSSSHRAILYHFLIPIQSHILYARTLQILFLGCVTPTQRWVKQLRKNILAKLRRMRKREMILHADNIALPNCWRSRFIFCVHHFRVNTFVCYIY